LETRKKDSKQDKMQELNRKLIFWLIFFKTQEGSIFRCETTLSRLQFINRKFKFLQIAHNTGNLFFYAGRTIP